MLLLEDPNADVIMVTTGTGIATFRSFMHRLFVEETVARHMFGGSAWLVLGVPTTGGLLYKEEIDAMLKNGEFSLWCMVSLSQFFCNNSRLQYGTTAHSSPWSTLSGLRNIP